MTVRVGILVGTIAVFSMPIQLCGTEKSKPKFAQSSSGKRISEVKRNSRILELAKTRRSQTREEEEESRAVAEELKKESTNNCNK